MKFLSAIILLTVAVAMADKDEDDWNFYKVKTKISVWSSHNDNQTIDILLLDLLRNLSYAQFQFGRKHSPKEEANRKRHFLARQRAMEKHNKENKDWQMGHNKFSDLVSKNLWWIIESLSGVTYRNVTCSILNVDLIFGDVYTQSDDEKVSLLGARPAIRRERLLSREVAVPVLDRALPASVT